MICRERSDGDATRVWHLERYIVRQTVLQSQFHSFVDIKNTYHPFGLDTEHVNDEIRSRLGTVDWSVVPGFRQIGIVIRVSVTFKSDEVFGRLRQSMTHVKR